MEDPVYTDWKRKYRKFPGVARCVELLGERNTVGSLVDIICGELEANAVPHASELIAAFRAASDHRLRILLLSVLCESRLTEALPVFVEYVTSEDEELKRWSIRGLRDLDTREARQALWDAEVTDRSHRRPA